MLLVATAFLGIGFGLTLPLWPPTGRLPPAGGGKVSARAQRAARAGHRARAAFVAVFVGLGFWWGCRRSCSALPLRTAAPAAREAAPQQRGIPPRFWVFAAFAVLYGICETLNGKLVAARHDDKWGASTTEAAVALTVPGMVTVGRVVFAAIERRVPLSRVTYRVLPFALAGTFVLIGFLSDGDVALGIVAFALAGSGRSALLPLTLRPGGARLDVGR